MYVSLLSCFFCYLCSFVVCFLHTKGGRYGSAWVFLTKKRSDLRPAAINEQFDARDETGVIRRQKQRRLGNFFGFAHASHRDGGHNPRDRIRGLLINGRGVGWPGA